MGGWSVVWVVVAGMGTGCQVLFPLELDPIPPPLAEAVVAGRSHTCAIRQGDRSLRCWGSGEQGRLGYGNTTTIGDDEPARDAGDLAIADQQLALGGEHSCAWGREGARCWGNNVDGRLGYGNMSTLGDNEALDTLPVIDVGGEVISMSAGGAHVCALLSGGPVTCWGLAAQGQLGRGNTLDLGDNELPGSLPPIPNITATAIATGAAHTCALLENTEVMCWGQNTDGQLGYGNTFTIGDNENAATAGSVQIATPFESRDLEALRVVAGDHHTCALLVDNTVTCWGLGAEGQLGLGAANSIGDDDLVASTARIPLERPALDIAAGANHSCALLETQAVRCWGRGAEGQLGYGNTANVGDDEVVPATDVALGEPAIGITAGGDHTCALLVSGNVICWGSGASGELGYGDLANIGDDETPESVGPVPLY